MTIAIIILIGLWIWIKFEAENAPLLTDDEEIIYKSHVSFFGIKLYKRKL